MDGLAAQCIEFGSDPRIRPMLARVCELTEMGFAAVARVTDTRWIACQVVDKIEFGLEPGEELDLKTTICNEIRTHGQTVVIDNVQDQPEWRTHPTPVLYGFQSYISVPILLDDGSFFGTLCAIDPEPHELSSSGIMVTMQDFARQIAAMMSERLTLEA